MVVPIRDIPQHVLVVVVVVVVSCRITAREDGCRVKHVITYAASPSHHYYLEDI